MRRIGVGCISKQTVSEQLQSLGGDSHLYVPALHQPSVLKSSLKILCLIFSLPFSERNFYCFVIRTCLVFVSACVCSSLLSFPSQKGVYKPQFVRITMYVFLKWDWVKCHYVKYEVAALLWTLGNSVICFALNKQLLKQPRIQGDSFSTVQTRCFISHRI
jgi:hypothetical protein